MPAPRTLAFKLLATGGLFLFAALASIALTLWVTWQLEGGAAAVNEAGRLRMVTYRLALDAPGSRAPGVQVVDDTLALLSRGDPSRPLFIPWSDDTRRRFDIVREHWPGLRIRWLAGTDVSRATADEFVADVDRLVAGIEQRLSHWTGVLRAFQFAMVAAAIASAVLLLYTSHLLVLEPLRRIGHGLASIRGGNFDARIEVAGSGEFAELSAGFNAMASRLSEQYRHLEARVAEKTAHLEVQRARLAALYEVSNFVARADTLDQLARGFAAKVRAMARADAVAIRWSDEANGRSLLLAQVGLPPALAGLGQCLRTGSCHCGQPPSDARITLVGKRELARGWGHCSRAGFDTLLTVPVQLHQRALGELNLFFRSARTLDDEERSLLETTAGHLAGGIESLKTAAAEKEAAVANERTLLARELHDSIAQSLAFLKIQVSLLRDALERDDASAAQHTLGEIDAGVRESYADVRELLVHFRTRANEDDIEPALRGTLKKFEHQTGLPARLEMQGHGVPLPPDVQVQVLHVLQEALSNVRKHAGATAVRVTVQQVPRWRFVVADDGGGFDVHADPGENHVGLRIMRERAAAVRASVDVRSSPGGGTVVSLTLPTADEELHEGADSTSGGG
jgi:two-component system nitrate/nitrite sensor histidine kinase NarX